MTAVASDAGLASALGSAGAGDAITLFTGNHNGAYAITGAGAAVTTSARCSISRLGNQLSSRELNSDS